MNKKQQKLLIKTRLLRGSKKIPSTGKGIPDYYVFSNGKVNGIVEQIYRLREGIFNLTNPRSKEER